MRIPSRTTAKFWIAFTELPPEVRALARKNYLLWANNPLHPSLHFKAICSPNWSVRVGQNYRAVGKFSNKSFLWEWIGSHKDYDARY